MVAPGGLPDSARSSREVIRKGTGDRPAAGDRRRGAGDGGRYLEFFAGRIANARTRAAYGRAVG